MEQSDAPDILVNPVGGNVFAALADHNRHFAFIVEAPGAFRIWNLFVGSSDLVRIFPKTPLALFARHASYLREIASDTGTPRPHAGEMRGVISADAGDTAFRPGSVELHAVNIVDDSSETRSGFGDVLDRSVGIFKSCRSQRNEIFQRRRNSLIGMGLRVGVAALLAQIAGESAVEVDHFVALPGADSFLGAKENNLHGILLSFLSAGCGLNLSNELNDWNNSRGSSRSIRSRR